MKLCVYAICKNEIKYISAWLESVKEADEVVVLDTGSTDGTWEILQNSGVKCYQKIFTPFRFDEARNYALSLISKDCDICLPLDIDSTMTKDFCPRIKKNWKAEYGIMWLPRHFINTNRSGKWFCHARKYTKWFFPVWEQIRFVGEVGYCLDTIINCIWDIDRPSHDMYFSLAELGVKENPGNKYCLYVLEQIQAERNLKGKG